jgi:hypothetical protein
MSQNSRRGCQVFATFCYLSGGWGESAFRPHKFRKNLDSIPANKVKQWAFLVGIFSA